MSVDVGNVLDRKTGIVLTEEERTELEIVASHVSGIQPRAVDDRFWIDSARDLSALLPIRLRQTLRRFVRDPGADAMLLLRNLPVDPESLPDTPSTPGSVQRSSTLPASVLALISLQLGELMAFQEEKSGALVQDVVPVPGMEEFQGNAGAAQLTMHVENAFHPLRPDLVGLMCLRNDHDNIAGLRVASIRNALPLLSEKTRRLLHEPRFVTAPPASFGDLQSLPEPHGILSGAPQDPDVKVDFTSTEALDPDAARAMAELGEVFAEVRRTVVLEPGDLAYVDNRLALHGRTAFSPRYDGRDRWLQRAFVQLDLRRSRPRRADDGQVQSSAAA
ncbi:TauD/TfdA family dioxygenase [Streptomyces sp. NBC_01591]|uniref:TauD/TfdA family dioxygenase n=1 Tax=Streptomyces sp. NBC_01591 TaxID=2975888 RepID=UPI002DD8F287|nr:TauD/TfdA family dioxygenase [Streptomyces sp. NBC_01591]WSD70593.1 TauD/TfdA family dioxygenase [Streptomyces sp. NBC_01591]